MLPQEYRQCPRRVAMHRAVSPLAAGATLCCPGMQTADTVDCTYAPNIRASAAEASMFAVCSGSRMSGHGSLSDLR